MRAMFRVLVLGEGKILSHVATAVAAGAWPEDLTHLDEDRIYPPGVPSPIRQALHAVGTL